MKTTFVAASAIVALVAVGAPPLASAEEQPASSPAPRSEALVRNAGTSGFTTKTYSVIVNVNGTLALGPAGAFSDDFSCAACGSYEVIFPSPVNGCAFAATIGDDLADVPAPGFVTVTQRFANVNGVFVATSNPNGFRANHAFHLIVQC
jgi:hypothetical protein